MRMPSARVYDSGSLGEVEYGFKYREDVLGAGTIDLSDSPGR